MLQVDWAPEWMETTCRKYPTDFESHCLWYPNNLKIVDKYSGYAIPFELNAVQKNLEWFVWQADRKQEMLFLEILKARRATVSTWSSATNFRRSLFSPNRNTISMSCDQQSTDFIHDMTRDFADSIREDCPACKGEGCKKCEDKGTVPLRLERDSTSGIKIEKNGSQFFLYTAGSRDRTGRGYGAPQLHFTEFDFSASEEFYVSVMQVTPNGWPTLVIIESTAHGPEGPMERHRQAAVRGENGFVPVFIAYFDYPEYRMALTWEELLARPQAGPIELPDARRWLEENRERAQTIRDRIGILREEHDERRRLGTQKSGAGRGGANENGKPRRVRDSRTGPGKSATTTGEKGTPAESRADDPGEVRGEGTGARGCVPDNDGGRDSRFWESVRRASRLRGRALLDPKRREWETALCLGLAGDDWREHAGRTIAWLESVEKFNKKKPLDLIEKACLIGLMVDSLSDYERDLIDEKELDLEQIVQLRWFKSVKCAGSEVSRRHEYPARADEPFSYPEESVLDPATIRQWTETAKEEVPKRASFRVKEDEFGEAYVERNDDPVGAVLIWEDPEPGVEYAFGVDPSSGLAKGDWCVGSMVRKDSGVQVAEFRSRMEPDRAISQIEGLGIYYNLAFTGVECNSIGLAFCRSLEDRGTLPLYERENLKRREPGVPTRQIGWLSSGGAGGTRDYLITNARQTVREGKCRIRSEETLSECRSLVVNRSKLTRNERIEARTGAHDDGFFAWGIALLMRNRLLQMDEEEGEPVRPEIEYAGVIEDLIEQSKEGLGKPRLSYRRPGVNIVSPGKRILDGRRNLL